MINAMRYTEYLVDAGFTKEQADTAIKVGLELMDAKFATKQDIQLSELALRSDMKEMEHSIRSDMKESEDAIRSEMKEVETSIRSGIKEIETSIRSDMKEMESSIRGDMKEMEGSIHSLEGSVLLITQELHAMPDKIIVRLSGIMAIMFSLSITVFKLLA
ncbi:MAG: hypothetical protein HON90_16740 [Halobacteriovoraceae bacterium]|jgi:hypothetical protein|nr:hypothetical protein [Halobacteriovoraceae bacterium]